MPLQKGSLFRLKKMKELARLHRLLTRNITLIVHFLWLRGEPEVGRRNGNSLYIELKSSYE